MELPWGQTVGGSQGIWLLPLLGVGGWHSPPASGGENQVYPTLRDWKAQLFAFIGIDAG